MRPNGGNCSTTILNAFTITMCRRCRRCGIDPATVTSSRWPNYKRLNKTPIPMIDVAVTMVASEPAAAAIRFEKIVNFCREINLSTFFSLDDRAGAMRKIHICDTIRRRQIIRHACYRRRRRVAECLPSHGVVICCPVRLAVIAIGKRERECSEQQILYLHFSLVFLRRLPTAQPPPSAAVNRSESHRHCRHTQGLCVVI